VGRLPTNIEGTFALVLSGPGLNHAPAPGAKVDAGGDVQSDVSVVMAVVVRWLDLCIFCQD